MSESAAARSSPAAGAGAGAGAGGRSEADGPTRADPFATLGEPGLTPIYLGVRIKPMTAEPGGGTTGAACSKHIAAWDADRGTVAIGGLRSGDAVTKRFAFPSVVVPPEADQATAYERLAVRRLVDIFVSGYDVNFLVFGQTGSGKTHTVFGPPGCLRGCSSGGGGIITADHGIILRAASDALDAVKRRAASGEARGVLTGSMVELYFESLADLLNKKTPCSLNDEHQLQGASEMPLETPDDVLRLAAAVELRTMDATLMNDTSSRSHCVTTLTLTQCDASTNRVTTSRFNFVDMMGSERSKGQNSAHDVRKNNKLTKAGCEGIFANLSLSQLALCVQRVAQRAAKGKKGAPKAPRAKPKRRAKGGSTGHVPFRFTYLTRFLSGSLVGPAVTAMVVTLSQAPRNGDETFHSLQYGEDMARLKTVPQPQPSRRFKELRREARDGLAVSSDALRRTNVPKYVFIRKAEVRKWRRLLEVLDRIGGDSGGGGAGATGAPPRSHDNGAASAS